MVLRILGMICLLIGGTLIALTVYGLGQTNSMTGLVDLMTHVKGLEIDSQDWSEHWTFAHLANGGIGVLTVAGGATLLCKKRLGLLFVSLAAAVAASLPWVLKASDRAQYAFETPAVVESIILGLTALVALFAFFYRRQQRTES